MQQSQGGIISGDGANADERNYYSKLEASQNNDLEPKDRFLIDLFNKTESSNLYQVTQGQPFDYEIEYNSLWSIDNETEAKIRKLNAESDKMDYETGKATSDELRENDERY